MESARDSADYPRYLLRLCELERIDRERRNVERRIRLARFTQIKSLDTFDFAAQPSLNKPLVLELARCEWKASQHGQAADRRQTGLRAVPFTAVGSELLFEVFSQRYERGATLVTSNLPFDEWTSVFGSERLTGALLDRLTHHVHILEMNGECFRLATAKKAQRRTGYAPTTKTTSDGDDDPKN